MHLARVSTSLSVVSLALALGPALTGCPAPPPEAQPEPPRDSTAPEPIGGSTGGESAAGPTPPSTDDAAWAGEDAAERAEGRTCVTSGDCPEGLFCFGPEGCERDWICVAPRPCTRDLVQYCACDGTTVEGSGSCPPRAYRHRGPCAP